MPSTETALCDTGPLVALFRLGDGAKPECEAALQTLEKPGLTTIAVLTEAFYFLDRPDEQQLLWKFVLDGALDVSDLAPQDLQRMPELMEKYADLPMDFADASLVAVSERLKLRTVFTLDGHFRVYRPRHTASFEIIP